MLTHAKCMRCICSISLWYSPLSTVIYLRPVWDVMSELYIVCSYPILPSLETATRVACSTSTEQHFKRWFCPLSLTEFATATAHVARWSWRVCNLCLQRKVSTSVYLSLPLSFSLSAICCAVTPPSMAMQRCLRHALHVSIFWQSKVSVSVVATVIVSVSIAVVVAVAVCTCRAPSRLTFRISHLVNIV